MDIREYLRVVRQSWVLITIITLAALAAATVYSLTRTPEYRASAIVYVSTQSASSVTDLSQGNSFTQQVVSSYARLIETPIVLQPVIDELQLDVTDTALAGRVEATVEERTVMINIAATDTSPARAAAIANAVANTLPDVVDQISPATGSTDSPIRVTTVQEAREPSSASSPNLPLNLALGLLIGLALGVCLAIFRRFADTRLHSQADLTRITDLPGLGSTHNQTDASKRLVVHSDPRSAAAEAYRAIRTNLEFLDHGDRAHSFVCTSPLQGDGKTTTISNLAIALADNGMNVVVVDADMRRPQLATAFGLEGAVGLSDVLVGRAPLDDVLQPWGSRSLSILPAGQVPPNPSELLASPAMTGTLDRLLAKFDIVLIDAPPLLPVTDAAILSKRVGGVVLIAAAGKTTQAQVRAALHVLVTAGAPVLGTILTMVTRNDPGTYSYGYGEYAQA